MTPYEISYWYGALLFFLYFGTLKLLRQDFFEIPPSAVKPLIARGILGATSNLCQIMSMQYVSLSKAVVICQTIPIWTAILSKYILKERLSYFDWIASVIAFIGILILQNPFQGGNEFDLRDMLGTLIALTSAILGALTFVSVRMISKQVHYLIPPLAFAIGNLLTSPMYLMARNMVSSEPKELTIYNWTCIFYLLVIVCSIYFGLIFQTLSFKYEKAGRVTPINYLAVVINCIIDIIVFNNHMKVNQVIGCLMIIGSTLSISLLKCFNVIK